MNRPINLSSFMPKVTTADWGINTLGFEFKKCSDLYQNQKYSIKGVYGQEGQFGMQTNIISDGFIVSLPSRYAKLAENIIKDKNAVEAIKAGGYTFSLTARHVEQFGNDTFDVELHDPEVDAEANNQKTMFPVPEAE